MLKRQRQSTPPPSVSELITVSDFPSSEPSALNHIAKRRRTAAPGLDGRARGMVHIEEDEDNWSDVEEDGESSTSNWNANAEAHELNRWEDKEGQYKDMNHLLHQLHFEQQRRNHLAQLATHATTDSKPSRYQDDSSAYASKHHRPTPDRSTAQSSGPPQNSSDNAEQVWSTYEANNRLLGSLFRQRLREGACEGRHGV